MNILITGCAGFIGFHSAIKFLENGYKVFGVDNLNTYYDPNLKKYRLNKLLLQKNFIFENADISDISISNIFKKFKPEIVINLAAQAGVRYSIDNPRKYFDSNIAGFFNILEACREFKVGHLLYASSSSVYGDVNEVPFSVSDDTDNPESFYAATKKCNELMSVPYSKLYGLNAIGLRFFTVYGPFGRPDMAPWLFTEAIERDRSIDIYNNGDMFRDFTYIDDIVDGLFTIFEKFNFSEVGLNKVYNLGFGKPVNLLKFVELIEDALGKKAIKNYLPFQQGDVHKTFANIDDLKSDYGYKPKIDIENGIVGWINWYKSYISN